MGEHELGQNIPKNNLDNKATDLLDEKIKKEEKARKQKEASENKFLETIKNNAKKVSDTLSEGFESGMDSVKTLFGKHDLVYSRNPYSSKVKINNINGRTLKSKADKTIVNEITDSDKVVENFKKQNESIDKRKDELGQASPNFKRAYGKLENQGVFDFDKLKEAGIFNTSVYSEYNKSAEKMMDAIFVDVAKGSKPFTYANTPESKIKETLAKLNKNELKPLFDKMTMEDERAIDMANILIGEYKRNVMSFEELTSENKEKSADMAIEKLSKALSTTKELGVASSSKNIMNVLTAFENGYDTSDSISELVGGKGELNFSHILESIAEDVSKTGGTMNIFTPSKIRQQDPVEFLNGKTEKEKDTLDKIINDSAKVGSYEQQMPQFEQRNNDGLGI